MNLVCIDLKTKLKVAAILLSNIAVTILEIIIMSKTIVTRTNVFVGSIIMRVVVFLMLSSCSDVRTEIKEGAYIPTIDSLYKKKYNHPDSIMLLLDDLNNSGYYTEADSLLDQSDWMTFFSYRYFLKDSLPSPSVVNAKDYIIKISPDYDVIILNETHGFPYQRHFARELASALFKEGFNQLGVEALCSNKVISLQRPLCYSDGFYTNEPSFSLFIMSSLDLGYDVFGYEECEQDDISRDEAMARNIIDKWNPSKGKMLIYCGWDHVLNLEGQMAHCLSEMKPHRQLRINQTNFNPRMPGKVQKAVRSKLLEPIQDVSIIVDSSGYPMTLSSMYDLEVIYPETSWGMNIRGYQKRYYEGSASSSKVGKRKIYSWKETSTLEVDNCEQVPVLIVPPGWGDFSILGIDSSNLVPLNLPD